MFHGSTHCESFLFRSLAQNVRDYISILFHAFFDFDTFLIDFNGDFVCISAENLIFINHCNFIFIAFSLLVMHNFF